MALRALGLFLAINQREARTANGAWAVGVRRAMAPVTANASDLWFQAREGDIHVVQGFTARGKSVLRERVQTTATG